MERYRFLVAPRWLGLTAAAVCAMVVCALLAQWQWGRATERSEANERIASGGGAVAVDELLPRGAELPEDGRWLLVEATGVYDTGSEIVLRAQTNESVNGYEVVTPLVLDDGTAILVDRGFVASETGGGVPDYPAAPGGEVTVTGRLYESEPAGGGVTEDGGLLQARRLSLEQLSEHLDYELRAAWIADVEPTEGLKALETPSFRAWQNYSYTVQWALFAAMIPVGWVVLVRRELHGADEPPAEAEPVTSPGSSSTAE